MSNTPRPKLFSDEQIDIICEVHPYHAQLYAKQTACWVRDFYEAARSKDAELIQELVDGLAILQYVFALERGYETRWGDYALDAASAAGFKPSEP